MRENSPNGSVTPPLTPIGEERCTTTTIQSPPLPIAPPFPSLPFPSLSFPFLPIFSLSLLCVHFKWVSGGSRDGGGKKKKKEVVSFTVLISHFRLLIPASQRPLNPTFLGAGRKVRLFSPFLSLHLRSSFSHENPRP